MPLMRCSTNNTSGWKYGQSGHCYTGPNAKKSAIKQGLAEGNGKLEAADWEDIDDNDFNELIADTDIPVFTRANLVLAKKLIAKQKKD